MTQLKGSATLTEFDRKTAPIQMADRLGRFAVDLDAGWSSLVGVHGGYMCALAVRAAESMVPGRAMHLGNDGWLAGSFEIHDSTGGLAVERGRPTKLDGTVVADSFQTRLTPQG